MLKRDLNDKKSFEEKITNFIYVMSNVNKMSNVSKKRTTPELMCNIYRYSKRKRSMESSTPVFNKRRERPMIEDQDESPIGQMTQNDQNVTHEDSSECVTNLNPTGVSDEMTRTHLTPLLWKHHAWKREVCTEQHSTLLKLQKAVG